MLFRKRLQILSEKLGHTLASVSGDFDFPKILEKTKRERFVRGQGAASTTSNFSILNWSIHKIPHLLIIWENSITASLIPSPIFSEYLQKVSFLVSYLHTKFYCTRRFLQKVAAQKKRSGIRNRFWIFINCFFAKMFLKCNGKISWNILVSDLVENFFNAK